MNLSRFKISYCNAIKYIERYSKNGNSNKPGMVSLVNWMLDTSCNPYQYLPHEWADKSYSAEGFVSLCQEISHALYGDGDITFVSVNGSPRIVFAHRTDDNFNHIAMTPSERMSGKTTTIKVLDITPDEFGPLCEQWEKDHISMIQRSFSR